MFTKQIVTPDSLSKNSQRKLPAFLIWQNKFLKKYNTQERTDILQELLKKNKTEKAVSLVGNCFVDKPGLDEATKEKGLESVRLLLQQDLRNGLYLLSGIREKFWGGLKPNPYIAIRLQLASITFYYYNNNQEGLGGLSKKLLEFYQN